MALHDGKGLLVARHAMIKTLETEHLFENDMPLICKSAGERNGGIVSCSIQRMTIHSRMAIRGVTDRHSLTVAVRGAIRLTRDPQPCPVHTPLQNRPAP